MSAALPPATRGAPEGLPERIGAYEVRGVIGTGSMGVVYLGHDPAIDRPVAIKTIQRHLLESDAQQHGAAARFRVEAQAAGRLNHRNIVAVYQFGEDQANTYIAMEYVEGHSLGEYLRRAERLSRGEVLCLMLQLLDALHYAHESGVVHRDIKPANLMVDREGRLKITDFGIARTESSQVTRVNTVVGSPGYMAPEQYTGGALDRRVDIFSAGVVLYQMLAGAMPFSGTDEAIMYQIVYGEHVALSRKAGDPQLAIFDPIVDSAIAKQPGERFASALEFREALRVAAEGPVADRLSPQRLLPRKAIAGAQPPQTRAGTGPESAPAVTHSFGGVSGTQPTTIPVPTGWDESALDELERELTRHVGPVARVLVRRAARGQPSLAGVRREVAAAIIDPDVRERFLTATGSRTLAGGAAQLSGTLPGAGPATAFPDTQPAGTAAQPRRVSPKDIEQAAQTLARSLGPLGPLLARRCAEGAPTREQFVARVIEQLSARVDPRVVEADLWRALK